MTERFRARVRDLQAVDVVALCILLVMVSSVALFAPARDAVADDGATGTGWTVLESTAERLRVRVEFAGESLALDPRTGHTVIRIAGAPAGGDPGLPSLPHTGRWLAVPPTGEATLRIDRLETEDLGVHRVVPTSTPRIDRDAPPGKPRLHEERIEGENYARFRTTAGDVVALDAPVFSRRQRMSALRVQPVIHDAATGRTSIVRTLEVTIEFPSSLARTQSTVSADETVGGVLLNPDVAARWTTLPPRLEAMRTETPLVRDATVQASLDASALVADPIRLRVNATDLYRVRAFSLVDEGELPETVRREQLRLVKLRPTEPGDPGFPAPDVIDVPLHFVGGPEPTEAVAVADQIIFYGLSVKDEWARWQQRPDEAAATRGRPDHYNNSNVYFLLAADPPVEGWARMTVAPAAPYDGSNPATEYQRVERFEQDGGYQEDPNNLSVERYHWNDGRDQGIAFGSVRAVAPIAGRELTVRFSAGRWRTESSSSQFNFALYDQNQNLQRNLGSQILASAEGGLVELERTASTDDLPDGGGPLLFGFSREDASSRVRGYFGYVELEYPASYRASGGRLRFGLPPTAGTYDVAVDGFSGGDLLLFDVTDAGAPRVLTLPDGSIADGEVRVRLEQAPPGRTYALSDRLQIPTVAAIEPDPVADLMTAIDDVQVLVVGPDEFRSESERYIDFRRDRVGGRDWNFAFVDVQQIYDQFSGGLQSPGAIRSLAAYGYANWGTKALVLMGDAGEDAREITGQGSPNRVPISTHIQNYDGQELLASDKWYGIFGFDSTSYPVGLRQTSDILVGRMPAGNVDELRLIVDKVIAYETVDTEGAWRRRSLWVSDDAYSGGEFIGGSQSGYCEIPSERTFATSQEASSNEANEPFDGTLTSSFLNLDVYTREFRPDDSNCATLSTVTSGFRNTYSNEFRSILSQGHLIVSYQGHANFDVLGHEGFLTYQRFSPTPIGIENVGKPFVFFGMGCHVSDFCQADETRAGSAAIGEVLLREENKGAIATYGSSGFEFLTPNAVLMEIMSQTIYAPARSSSPTLGDDLRSQWVLGEILAQGELNTLSANGSYGVMVSQYNLLGDPLQRLDAAPARLRVQNAGGSAIADGTELAAASGDSTVVLQLIASDESGVHRIEVTDDRGRTWLSTTPGSGDLDRRRIERSIDLPILPQDYTIEVVAYDESYPTLKRQVSTFPVRLDLRLFVDGEELSDPSTLVLDPDRRTALEITFDSPVDLTSDEIVVAFDGVELENLVLTGGPRAWTVGADALPRIGATIGTFSITLAGETTVIADPDAPGPTGTDLAVVQHAPVPSPFADRTWVTAHVQGVVESARLTVYDLTGRPVYSSDRFETHDVASQGETLRAVSMEWGARDRFGDEVANGTYLYRIEVDGPSGRVRSEMGRVVVMR